MILEAKHITIEFGRKRILSDVTFGIEKNGLYGLVGENGSGKSTLLKILIGQLKPHEGSVVANGKFGYCPQDTLLFPELTVEENFRYFASAYGLNKEWKREFHKLLKQFNFEESLHQRVEELSGGTRQKANLCIGLIHDPDILILDEPYSGFDWDTYQHFWEYTDIILERGRTVLVVTHFLSERERFDHIFQLRGGQLR